MVPREQRLVITLAMLALPAFAQQNPKTFYPDDPLWREPAPRPVKQVEKREVDDLYDFPLNSFVVPGGAQGARRQYSAQPGRPVAHHFG
jgi:hypothetical protein